VQIYCSDKCRQQRTKTNLAQEMLGERGRESRVIWCQRHKKCVICFAELKSSRLIIGSITKPFMPKL